MKIELTVGINYMTGKLNCVSNKQLIKARQKNYKKMEHKKKIDAGGSDPRNKGPGSNLPARVFVA